MLITTQVCVKNDGLKWIKMMDLVSFKTMIFCRGLGSGLGKMFIINVELGIFK